MIKDIKILNKNEVITPEKGYYVDLEYTYPLRDDAPINTVGPFSNEYKDLYIEFLNTLQRMVNKYKGMKKFVSEEYSDILGYKFFFKGEYELEEKRFSDNKTIQFINSLNIIDERLTESDTNFVAQLMNFTPYYHDGESIEKYPIILIEEEINNEI